MSSSGDPALEETMLRVYAVLKPRLDHVMATLSSLDPNAQGSAVSIGESMLKWQKALQDMQLAMSSLLVKKDGDSTAAQLVGVALGMMSAYILLPFAMTLQKCSSWKAALTAKLAAEESASSSSSPAAVRLAALRRAVVSCSEQGARCISSYVSCLPDSPLVTLPSESIVKTLVALAMSLPVESSPPPSSSSSSPPSSSIAPQSTADDESTAASLVAVSDLLFPPSTPSKKAEETAATIASTLQGALVAQLVQSSLSLSTSTHPSPSSPGARDRSHQRTGVQTLRRLLALVPSSSLWRSLFPGTFSSLFKLSYSQLSAPGSALLVSDSLAAAAELLAAALPDSSNRPSPSSSSSSSVSSATLLSAGAPKDALRKLLSAPAAGAKAQPKAPDGLDAKYVADTRERLVPLLSVLVHNTRSHPSAKIRSGCASLCRTGLLSCPIFLDSLVPLFIDSLLMQLLDDGPDSPTSAAREALKLYRLSMRDTEWARFRSDQVSPRVVELLSSLPTSVRSGSGHVLPGLLDLLSGYVLLSDGIRIAPEGIDPFPVLLVDSASLLFEPCVEAGVSSVSSALVNVPVGEDTALVASYYRRGFTYLNTAEKESKARRLLRTLGYRLLKLNQLPEVVEAFLNRLHSQPSDKNRPHRPNLLLSAGSKQVQWLRTLGGIPTVVQELIDGARCPSSEDVAELSTSLSGGALATATATAPLSSSPASDSQEAVLDQLESIAWQIIPCIMNSFVWRLPATAEAVAAASRGSTDVDGFSDWEDDDVVSAWVSGRGEKFTGKDLLARKGGTKSFASGALDVSADALDGNAHFVASLCELVGTFADALKERIAPLFPEMLYLLVEKVGEGHPIVATAALATLRRICAGCGYSNVRELLTSNMDYLVDSLVKKLSGSRVVSEDLAGVVRVLLEQGCDLLLLRDVVAHCLKSVDEGWGEVVQSAQHTTVVLRILSSIVTSICKDLTRTNDERNAAREQKRRARETTKSHSSAAVSVVDAEDDACTSEGASEFFKKYHAKKADDEATNGEASEEEEQDVEEKKLPSQKEQREILFKVLYRAVFYFAMDDLTVVVVAFDLIKQTFEALGLLTNEQGYGVPILIGINDVWAILMKRAINNVPVPVVKQKRREFLEIGASKPAGALPSMLTSITKPSAALIVAAPIRTELSRLPLDWHEKPKDQTKEKVVMKNLFRITTFLCGKAKDFMARRVEGELFNAIARVLGAHEKAPKGEPEALIVEALHCLQAIFAHSGDGLQDKVAIAGALVIVWMGNEGRIGDAAYESAEALCATDGAAMRPGLSATEKDEGLLGKRARALLSTLTAEVLNCGV